VNERGIQIHHHHDKDHFDDCVRCKLNDIGNDDLSIFLNTELPKQGSRGHWYWKFRKYKNQVTHRALPNSFSTGRIVERHRLRKLIMTGK
jgi:hypothetical protein